MCGITGIAGHIENPIENINAMNDRIIRRGPDASGYWMDENKNVILGHRRLSIIDLTETGSQPMASHSGRYVIVYNGEIYNSPAIREKLEKDCTGIAWRGTSDTEVLLEAIEQYGMSKTLTMCKGMWGIAVFDRESGQLMLSRDRMGEKPLYYGMVAGCFVFASDINSIKAVKGFNGEIDNQVTDLYLMHGYIPAPYTIYKGIYKLEAGEILTVAPPFNTWKTEKYFDIESIAIEGQRNLFDGSEEEAAEELELLLREALKGQMLSDVPLGAFLSGGIDSTLTVSLMQQISDTPVRSFTIGFEEEKYNEAVYAKETAAYLGTNHTELYVGYEDVMDILPKLSEAFGEPFADSSQLPTMLVSKMTREHVTVALSGDAGDEFYCGYNTYKDSKDGLKIMQSKLGFIKEPVRGALGRTILSTPFAGNERIRTAGRCLTVRTAEDHYRCVSDDDVRAHKLVRGIKGYKDKIAEYSDGLFPDAEHNLMLMDMKQYLTDDILCKVDRAGMYYSLETRIPLLDVNVMRFAWSLPLEYKMSGKLTKKPLRNILYKYVPQEMMDRPKKGFSVPVSRWLREGEMNEWAQSIIDDSRNIAGDYIDVSLVDRMWKDYLAGGNWSDLIWYVLVLEQWLKDNN